MGESGWAPCASGAREVPVHDEARHAARDQPMAFRTAAKDVIELANELARLGRAAVRRDGIGLVAGPQQHLAARAGAVRALQFHQRVGDQMPGHAARGTPGVRGGDGCAPAQHLAAGPLQLAVFGKQLRQGSTTRAAQAMHLSQPAVARSVLQLEEACGLPLFMRGARGMMPTPLGSQLAARIESMLQHLGSGAADAQAAATLAARRPPLPERFAETVPAGQLRALMAIADCGSESLAAQWLGLTQPAVHAALQGLETSLGMQLFYKLAFGTRLTPSGEALLRRVKLALAEVRGMDSDISAWRGEIRGRVVVGVLPLSVGIFLPRAVEIGRASCRERV